MWEDSTPFYIPDPYEEIKKPSSKAKPEGEHTTSLIKGLHKIGAFAYKIPDPVGSYKVNPRPFDVIACYQGKSIAIECKWIKQPKAFGMSSLRPVQINGLNKHQESGGLSLVVLFLKYRHKINMLVWDWQEFKNHNGTYKKYELLEGLENGKASQKTGGIFTATWLQRRFSK